LNIVMAEDHEWARMGLSFAIQDKSPYKIVAKAENGQQAVELVSQHLPDLVLMDIGMPVMDGITATQEIKRQFPDIKVVMLTSHQEGEQVYAALGAGADGYCLKDIKVKRLIQVIALVMEGTVWL